MRELSLFSGVGGGLLGTKLLGWRTIGYVEWNEYCQQIIAQRIKDGIFDNAPIFTDIDEFVQSGAARQYRGFVDVVTAGFPCQPFSLNGKRAEDNDERNKWPQTLAVINDSRPRFAFLENVTGLRSTEYFNTIIADLAESGYDCRWRTLSAAELGASHHRDRLWIVAYDSKIGIQGNITKGISKIWESPKKNSIQAKNKRIRSHILTPYFCRKRNDIPNYVDRVSALGNAQVPIVAATAWELLTHDLDIK